MYHHRVVRMLYVKNETEQVPVLVYQNTLEIHTKVADQSVLLIQIVPQIRLVSITSVKILVLELVVQTHYVKL